MQQPTLNPTPFAQDGQKNTIPDTASGGSASFSQGFPALTMTPISQGGIPPSGQDFNGILNHLDSHVVWQSAGMGYSYDNNFANAIGGYAVGAVLRSKDGLTAYVNTIAGNKTDPESGQDWAVYAGGALLKSAQAYQVGDIYTTTNNYPNGAAVTAALGYGNWVRYGKGLTLVGHDPSATVSGSGAWWSQLGNIVGEFSHTLTIDEMPSHTHKVADTKGIDGQGGGWDMNGNASNFIDSAGVQHTGGDKAHNNIQPSIVVAFWLRVADPATANVPQLYNGTDATGAGGAIPIAAIGNTGAVTGNVTNNYTQPPLTLKDYILDYDFGHGNILVDAVSASGGTIKLTAINGINVSAGAGSTTVGRYLVAWDSNGKVNISTAGINPSIDYPAQRINYTALDVNSNTTASAWLISLPITHTTAAATSTSNADNSGGGG